MADKDQFDEFIEAMGGLEQLYRDCEDSDRRLLLLHKQASDLVKEHPHQWVALTEGDVYVFGESHEALLESIRRKGLKTENAITLHLDPNPPSLILPKT